VTACWASVSSASFFTASVYLLVRDSPEAAGLAGIDGAPEVTQQTLSEVLEGVRAVSSERETWIMGVMLFFATGMNFTVMGLWGVPYVVQAYDVSVQTASLYTLVGNAGLIVGSPVLGWLSDRLERRTGIILAAAGGASSRTRASSSWGRPCCGTSVSSSSS